MLIARRNMMAGGYTAKDYVQDGLISHVDGIENRGYGDHQEAEGTLSFVDLKGLLKPSSSMIKNMTLGPKTISSNDAIGRDDRWNGAIYNALNSGRMTVEWSGIIHFGETAAWHGVCAFGSGNEIRGFFGGTTSGKCQFSINSQIITSLDNEIAHHLTATFNDGTANVYFNSLEFGTFEAALAPSWTYWFGAGFGGRFLESHFMRIYNRALTPAEIAHNYAVDKARFNLT